MKNYILILLIVFFYSHGSLKNPPSSNNHGQFRPLCEKLFYCTFLGACIFVKNKLDNSTITSSVLTSALKNIVSSFVSITLSEKLANKMLTDRFKESPLFAKYFANFLTKNIINTCFIMALPRVLIDKKIKLIISIATPLFYLPSDIKSYYKKLENNEEYSNHSQSLAIYTNPNPPHPQQNQNLITIEQKNTLYIQYGNEKLELQKINSNDNNDSIYFAFNSINNTSENEFRNYSNKQKEQHEQVIFYDSTTKLTLLLGKMHKKQKESGVNYNDKKNTINTYANKKKATQFKIIIQKNNKIIYAANNIDFRAQEDLSSLNLEAQKFYINLTNPEPVSNFLKKIQSLGIFFK